MHRNARAAVLSLEGLRSAWESLYRRTKPLSRNTIGVDGVSINDFHADAKGRLARLSDSIKSNRYSFSPLKPYLIPKTKGKWRLISVPTVADRIVQGALVAYLSEKYHDRLANNVSFGFIRDRGVHMAADIACKTRAKLPWVYKTDITAFFDTISRDVLKDVIRRTIKERSLHALLFDILDAEVCDANPRTNSNIAKLNIVRGRGVRQGMPLSPFFSNLMLMDFDRKVHAAGMSAVRYADDLIFLCTDSAECERMAEFCAKELEQIGLSVPPIAPDSKSVIYAPDQPAEFLGLELAAATSGYELRLSALQMQKLKQEILGYGNLKELVSRRITMRNFGYALMAKKNGYLSAYSMCTNLEQLAADLDRAERDALKRVFGALGINLKAIGAHGRAFLGIAQ